MDEERPKGIANIHEVDDGNKDVIVVITTADFDGMYAKECRGTYSKPYTWYSWKAEKSQILISIMHII